MIAPNPVLGVLLLTVGASIGATCFTPQKNVRGWSWQSYWLTMAVLAWLLMPTVGAIATIPELGAVLRSAPRAAMRNSFWLGAAYGFGAIAFGLAIRAIGFSLTYAIAIGLSAVLGTLVPPMLDGTLETTLRRPGAAWVVAGLAAGIAGIALTGWAGRLKDRDLAGSGTPGEFRLGTGLTLALAAGVLSAFYGFALAAGEPIADVASKHGAGIYRGNVTYLFANTGTFVVQWLYCAWLHRRAGTWRELTSAPSGGGSLAVNYFLGALSGVFWYGQFFFYNLGNVRMGAYKFTSWAIHMILTVLISTLVGLGFREWRGCRRRTLGALGLALTALVASILLLTWGHRLGAAGG